MKNDKEKFSSYILTRETLGMTVLLFSALLFVALSTGSAVFAGIGTAICTFMYGTFGYACFLVVALLAYLGAWLVFEKKIQIPAKTKAIIALSVLVLFLLFHAVSTNGYSLENFGDYVAQCYTNASLGFSGYTFGGVISAIIVYPVAMATTFIGAYIIFSILSVLCIYLAYLTIKNDLVEEKANTTVKVVKKAIEEPVVDATAQPSAYDNNAYDNNAYDNSAYAIPTQVAQEETLIAPTHAIEPKTIVNEEPEKDKFSNLGKKIIFEKGEFAAESYRRNMIFNENSYFNNPIHNEGDYLLSFSDGKKKPTPEQNFANNNSVPEQNKTYSISYQNQADAKPLTQAPTSYVYGDCPVENLSDNHITADSYKVEEINEPEQIALKDEILDRHEEEIVKEDVSQREEYNYALKKDEERKSDLYVQSAPKSDDSVADIDFTKIARNTPAQIPTEQSREERSGLYSLFSAENTKFDKNSIEPDVSRLESRNASNANLFDDVNDEEGNRIDENVNLSTSERRLGEDIRLDRLQNSNRAEITNDTPKQANSVKETPTVDMPRGEVASFARGERKPKTDEPTPVEETKQKEKPKHVWKKYVRPSLELLKDYPDNANVNTGEIEESKQIIVETLVRFRIESEIADVVIGPAITRYDVIIKDKANLQKALKYKEAIAMELKKENVNAYLNYAKGAVSFEIPNKKQGIVGLKNMLVSKQFMCAKSDALSFALGKDYDGEAVCPDITKMPHLLVAGATRTGKSVCLSSLLISLLYKYGPEELRLILVDPKQVEFISYDKLPHLMINEIIFDVDKAIKALNWAIAEMERRYKLFKEMTENGSATKDLTEYNSHVSDPAEKLPKIVIILDEFGDLMLQAKKDVETRIVRLVQKARACGIHLILATQRPSVDCITGLIKSNLPTRIGFKVSSVPDSMTIFDVGGAEKLIGNGDMYFRSSQNPDLTRIQGAFVSSEEVQSVTDFVKHNNETYFDQTVSDFINKVEEPPVEDVGGDVSLMDESTKIDDVYVKALGFCVSVNQASVNMIQRRFPIGYIKACKIIDWMANMNYITQAEGSKARKVLLSRDEFVSIYGEIDD